MKLSIPDSVITAIRLPEQRIEQELLIELAVSLYSQQILSFGKARELAGMGKYEFGKLLGERKINRHYGLEELEDDLIYAGGE
ncbi:MAG: UPF0175 family protein [Sphaerospermopsis sp. SIO1G2]|nr:UPF0175 family protein [Sphaerospermopsis sp. SIO1G1]NET72373.1 UPF0175 family protein [Sphaerospermopsis sp. SIO1G2]